MKKNTQFSEFLPSFVLAMEKPPSRYARMVSLIIIAFVVIAITWASLAKVDVVVSAQGKVVLAGNIKLVQAPEAGVIRAIHVKDGQWVEAGQDLLDFDATVSTADFVQLKTRFDSAKLALQRTEILLGNQNLTFGSGVNDVALLSTEKEMLENSQRQSDEQLKQLQFEQAQSKSVYEAAELESTKKANQITFFKQKSEESTRHAKEGLIAKRDAQQAVFDLENAQKDYLVQQEKAREAQKKYHAARAKAQAFQIEKKENLYKQLVEKQREFEEARSAYVASQQQMQHQTLKAPVAGVVQQLKVHTIGAVVTRADELLVLVPKTASLEVDVSVLNKDIGFLHAKQKVNVKVDAFEYTRYGYLQGEIEWVASDAVLDEQKGPVYPTRIRIESTQLPRKVNDKIALVLPGMSVTADILIGKRRLISYFFGPILRYKDEALNER